MQRCDRRRPCPHGLDLTVCPACLDDLRDRQDADALAALDPETRANNLIDFLDWSASDDLAQAESYATRSVP